MERSRLDWERIWSIYSKQEFMTPGVEETLSLASEVCEIGRGSRVLEVAFGKARLLAG